MFLSWHNIVPTLYLPQFHPLATLDIHMQQKSLGHSGEANSESHTLTITTTTLISDLKTRKEITKEEAKFMRNEEE